MCDVPSGDIQCLSAVLELDPGRPLRGSAFSSSAPLLATASVASLDIWHYDSDSQFASFPQECDRVAEYLPCNGWLATDCDVVIAVRMTDKVLSEDWRSQAPTPVTSLEVLSWSGLHVIGCADGVVHWYDGQQSLGCARLSGDAWSVRSIVHFDTTTVVYSVGSACYANDLGSAVGLFDVRTGGATRLWENRGPIAHAAALPSHHLVATVSGKGADVTVVDLRKPTTPLSRAIVRRGMALATVDFVSDQYLLVGGSNPRPEAFGTDSVCCMLAVDTLRPCASATPRLEAVDVTHVAVNDGLAAVSFRRPIRDAYGPCVLLDVAPWTGQQQPPHAETQGDQECEMRQQESDTTIEGARPATPEVLPPGFD
eukprot:NODE_586_length_1785_cov_80.085645_g576_i0.p1 GENE.NODE_586_length_1785_cov_80.085645_g576_i0~~NODE_586_length_1785_cov_80.085645_g576_i0.p1  ORF type:complete len:369 (-),score=33.45 NODE_586_length_1785_cov_80.085645_g576_i0:606-1712(-)